MQNQHYSLSPSSPPHYLCTVDGGHGCWGSRGPACWSWCWFGCIAAAEAGWAECCRSCSGRSCRAHSGWGGAGSASVGEKWSGEWQQVEAHKKQHCSCIRAVCVTIKSFPFMLSSLTTTSPRHAQVNAALTHLTCADPETPLDLGQQLTLHLNGEAAPFLSAEHLVFRLGDVDSHLSYFTFGCKLWKLGVTVWWSQQNYIIRKKKKKGCNPLVAKKDSLRFCL